MAAREIVNLARVPPHACLLCHHWLVVAITYNLIAKVFPGYPWRALHPEPEKLTLNRLPVMVAGASLFVANAASVAGLQLQ